MMFRKIALLLFVVVILGVTSVVSALPVTFNVRMGQYIKQGKFNKAVDFIDVAGTFNGWSGGTAWRLTDANNDSVYTLTAENAAFTAGATIEFKFRINGSWGGTEEFAELGGSGNRRYTVLASNNIITVWYSDVAPPSGPPVAGFSASSSLIYTGGKVYFSDISGGIVTGRRWYFEGGVPGFSTEEKPEILYTTPGSYDVTLVSFNGTEKDSVVFENYITVNDRPAGQVKWWNDAVFYEIFVRSFYDSNGDGIGDIKGIIQKLDYLNDGDPNTTSDLGITGIWLMPISPSPSYHGYDVTNYRGIHASYGTMADFKELLTKARARGIRIIVDFVMNHSSSQHPWFTKSAANDPAYRNFYRWSTTNPGGGWHSRNNNFYYGYFSSGMPDLNYENPAVKDSMFAITNFWLKEVGVDGFRLDAAIHIFEEGSIVSNAPKTFPFWGDFNAVVKAANPDAFSVGESWTSFDFMKQYVSNERLDYVFEFDVASSILTAVNNGSTLAIRQAIQRSYNTFPFLQFGTFLTNHDQNRVANVFGNNIGKMKTAASIYLTLPGIPYIYYGEEIGMQGAKPDEDIRKPLQWTSGTNGGFTTGVPWRSLNTDLATVNIATQSNSETSLLSHYKKMIALRNELPAIRRGSYTEQTSSNTSVFAFKRGETLESGPVMVMVNTSGTARQDVQITTTGLNYCGNSASGACGQLWEDVFTGENYTLSDGVWTFSFAAYETKVLKLVSITLSSEDETTVPVKVALFQNYPNPFNPSTTIRYSLPNVGNVKLDVLDMNGRSVITVFQGSKSAGTHSEAVDLSRFASGVYFYRLQVKNEVLTKKMVLVK